MDYKNLLILSTFLAIFGILGAVFVAKKNGHIDFLERAHWWSLVFMVLAAILTWISMVWMTDPSNFHVTTKQWVAFVMSVLIGVLVWARFAYTVSG